MKFVVISDTHGLHKELMVPAGDVIIHAGDITDFGTEGEVQDFLDWFSMLDFEHKVFIGGNHDIFLDDFPVDFLEILPPGITYLRNNGCQIDGIRLWGSPVSPDLTEWAFGKPRHEMGAHWQFMPQEIDILITHTPPRGILDQSADWISLGCSDLLEKVREIKPQFHVFGHIHASYGMVDQEHTTFINASNLDSYRGLINPPVVFEY